MAWWSESSEVEKCSGTVDNLLIDRMVCQDNLRGMRNLSMAWVDVRKAFDKINHRWLGEMYELHRFPRSLGVEIRQLSNNWNTRIVVETRKGKETSEIIIFQRGLQQDNSFCLRFFTLCLNPIAWNLNTTEWYKLSKPIGLEITDLLYIDDLKVFAASESKLLRVLRSVKDDTDCVGLKWNEKKRAVAHVKRGCLI